MTISINWTSFITKLYLLYIQKCAISCANTHHDIIRSYHFLVELNFDDISEFKKKRQFQFPVRGVL